MDISPIILRANYDGDVNGFSLEFREDGTYKFFNYSFFVSNNKRAVKALLLK